MSGQRDPKRTASAVRRYQREMSAAHLDGPLRNRQTEPCPAAVFRSRPAAPVEPIEDVSGGLGGNPWTVVDHLQRRPLRRFGPAYADAPADTRVLDRVVDQVDERLPQHDAVGRRAPVAVRLDRQQLTLLFGEDA